jgi:hypothetical protein
MPLALAHMRKYFSDCEDVIRFLDTLNKNGGGFVAK